MTANRIVSLAFGLSVTLTGAAFFVVDWIASALPSITAA
jgi:hypothetical protein